MCSAANMNLSAYANNDVISREVSSPIEFAIPVQLGYIQSNPIIPLNRGFFIKINLCADAMALYGLNADKFTVSIDNVYLMGDYFDLDKPLADLDMTYTSRKHRNGTLNSNNEFLNVDLNLAQVQSIYHNFSPKTWKESYSYNSFSTCPLLEQDNTTEGFKVARIKQYNTNRGAVRFPNLYPVDETDINKEPNGFQTLRSRLYIDSIFPYVYNRRCLISPVSEGLAQMVAAPTSALRTSQSVDFGFNQQWKKTLQLVYGVELVSMNQPLMYLVLEQLMMLCLPVSRQTSKAHLITILLNLNLITHHRAFSCIAMLEQVLRNLQRDK
jgi:hypothetical protein